MGQGHASGSDAKDVGDTAPVDTVDHGDHIDRMEADVERLRRRGQHLTLELLSRVRPKVNLALAISDKLRNVAGPIGVVGVSLIAGVLAGMAVIARIKRRRRPTSGQRIAKLVLIATGNRYD